MLKLRRWRGHFSLLLCLWSASLWAGSEADDRFSAQIDAALTQGLDALFPDGYETLSYTSIDRGESFDHKEKLLLKDEDDKERTLFLKTFDPDTPLGERQRVMAATKCVATLWQHPQFLWGDGEGTLMMQEYVEGGPATIEHFQNKKNLQAFIQKLKKSHEMLSKSDIAFEKESLVVRTQKRLQELLEIEPSLRKRLEAAVAYAESFPPVCTHVVHGDVQGGNILVNDQGTFLIDWSEVSYGDPLEDLGSLAEQLAFTEDQERQALEAYFGKATDHTLKQLKRYRLLNRLHFGCYFLREGIKEEHRRKDERPKGLLGLAFNPKIDKGMRLLRVFLSVTK